MSDSEGIRSLFVQMAEAAMILQNGGLVAFPTDTLYALGADAFNEKSILRVFAVKNRSLDLALPVLIGDRDIMADLATGLTEQIWDLSDKFWPGPLTIVVKKSASISNKLTAGQDTIAIRMPDHGLALDIINRSCKALIGTSANIFGGPDPITPRTVRDQIGDKIEMVIDGGTCPMGGASTILDMTYERPTILRQGVLPFSDLKSVLPNIREVSGKS